MEWKPIASAPRDGTEILLGHPDGSLAVGWWGKFGVNIGWTDGDYLMSWPSHWMPAPAPPERKE